MAMVSIKKDLFGKSDATRNLCSKHVPRYSMVSSQLTCDPALERIANKDGSLSGQQLLQELINVRAELADQVRVTEEHQRLRYACETRNSALEAALRPLAMAAKSWHDFHHDDAGFSAVQCDEICKALPTALAVLTPSETPMTVSNDQTIIGCTGCNSTPCCCVELRSVQETPPKPITTFTGWIQGPCENCGKSAREHIGISMGCAQAETKGDAT